MDLNLFFENLASEKPVPGGGSASCISAAMAASLLEMVAHLSIGRKNEPQIDEGFSNILLQLNILKPRLFRLAEEDANGYQKVMEAFKLSRNTEDEKVIRKQAIERAFEGAISTPLTLLEETINLIEWNAFTLKHGNINAFSDAGVAYHLIQTAHEGGKMNVLINLDSLHDNDAKSAYLQKLKNIEERFKIKKKEIENQIKTWMGTIKG
jgi:formiminotetrahydrofolate cyclodeaminase